MSYRAGLIHGKLDIRRGEHRRNARELSRHERNRAWNEQSGRAQARQPVSPAKVLIVDDHPAVREGLVSRISRQTDLIVCGEAAMSPRPCGSWKPPEPDVVVIDISLRAGNGIDLIKRIKARDSSIRMLVCSMHPDSLYAERALASRSTRLHQQGKHHRPDSRRHSIRARRRDLPERRRDPPPGAQDDRASRQSRALPRITLRSRARNLQADRRGPSQRARWPVNFI